MFKILLAKLGQIEAQWCRSWFSAKGEMKYSGIFLIQNNYLTKVSERLYERCGLALTSLEKLNGQTLKLSSEHNWLWAIITLTVTYVCLTGVVTKN